MHHLRSRYVRAAFAAIVLALAAVARAAGGTTADNVLSANIKEADGTTGQDTNTGAGVKTGHLQDGAVTAAKLAAGAIDNAAIADGAVTDAKIAGLISASKLEGMARVITVAETGADFTNPADAVAWVTNNGGGTPFVVRVAPGTYPINTTLRIGHNIDVEGSGEGLTRVVGTVCGNDSWYGTVAAVDVSLGAQLRFLTVENDGAGLPCSHVVALRVGSGSKVSNVTATASGAPENIGVVGLITADAAVISHATISVSGGGANWGYWSRYGSRVTIEDSHVTVSSTNGSAIGIYAESGGNTMIVRNTAVTASGATGEVNTVRLLNTGAAISGSSMSATGGLSTGMVNYVDSCQDCIVRVENSSMSSPVWLIRHEFRAPLQNNLFVANTRLGGGGQIGTGFPLRCFGTYDDALNAVVCP